MLANTKTCRSYTLVVVRLILLLQILLLQTTTLPAQNRAQNSFLDNPIVAIWRFDVARMSKFPPVYIGNNIYIASSDAVISAVERFSGKQVWRTEVGGEVSTSLAADNRSVCVSTRKAITAATNSRVEPVEAVNGSLHCLGASSGLTQWVKNFSLSLVGNLEMGKAHLFSFDTGNTLYAFDKTTGATIWSLPFNTKLVGNIHTQNDLLIIGAEDNVLYAIDQQTGKIVWQTVISGKSKINNVEANARKVFVGTQDGRLSAFDLSTGLPTWRKKHGGSIKTLVTTGNRIIVATANNVIYCIESSRGGRVWKRELIGRIAGFPATTGDAILIATVAGEDCVVLRISDGKIINTINVGSDYGLILQATIAGEFVLISTDVGVVGYAPIRDLPNRVQ